MTPLDLLIHEAVVEIHDDRYARSDPRRVVRYPRFAFAPIPSSVTDWGDGHCQTVVSPVSGPPHQVEVAQGERFTLTYTSGIAVERLRVPEMSIGQEIDATTALFLARNKLRGLQLLGAESVEIPIKATAPVAPPKPERRPLLVDFGPPPVGPPPKRTQLSIFDFEDEPSAMVAS